MAKKKSASKKAVKKRTPSKRVAKKKPTKRKVTKKKATKKKPAKKRVAKKAAVKRPAKFAWAKKRTTAGEEKERERKAKHAASTRSAAANIGQIPSIAPEYQELRDACEHDVEIWHQEVFPLSTGLKPFGESQRQSIGVSKMTIVEGGRTQKIEPRAFGKTTRTTNESLWALLYDWRNFVCVCGANTDFATDIFEAVQLELESNPILLAMFPEVCYPIWELDGKAIKARSQHIDGEPTFIKWQKDKIVFASVKGASQSGSIIVVKSIRAVRGAFQRTKDKGVLRPDLYLLDDIQTDDSAASDLMTSKILNNYIKKGVLRGGGWSTATSVVNVATIIQPDDVPDTLSRDPAWITSRFKFLLSPSDNEDFWFGPYKKAKQGYRKTGNPEQDKKNKKAADIKATQLYLKNRKKADKGAKVSWDWAYAWEDEAKARKAGEKPTCVSATQTAYDVRIEDGEETFASELQSDPIRINTSCEDTSKATIKQLSSSIITIPRGIVPIDLTRLIVYIDLHKRAFYWACVAKNLHTKNRHVVDYNTWPEQSSAKFTLENCKRTIPQLYPGMGIKAMAEKAVTRFLTIMAAKRWKDQNGRHVQLDEIRIDANWGGTTKNVRRAIRNHPAAEKVWGCHGAGRPATQSQLDEWALKPGEERGPGYIDTKVTPYGVKTKKIDTNLWKTETHIAITTPNEEAGTLTFFDGDDMLHELFFKSVLVEDCEARTGRVDIEEWKNPKNGQNHLFDCLVGACVDDDKSPTTGPTGNTYSF